MNPFLTLLIMIPLIVSGIFAMGAIFGLIKHGPRWDIFSAFALFTIICGYLVELLRRSLTRRWALLEFPGSAHVDISVKEKLTSLTLLETYFVIGLLAIYWFKVASVRKWAGLVLFTFGFILCCAAIYQLRQQRTPDHRLSAGVTATQLQMIEASLSSSMKKRNYFLISLVSLGLLAVMQYMFLGGASYWSFIDLLGFLFLVFSYGLWFILTNLAKARRACALRQAASEGPSGGSNYTG
jgi:hypothetical protein